MAGERRDDVGERGEAAGRRRAISAEVGSRQHQQRQPPARRASPRVTGRRDTQLAPTRLPQLAIYPTETISTISGISRKRAGSTAAMLGNSNCREPIALTNRCRSGLALAAGDAEGASLWRDWPNTRTRCWTSCVSTQLGGAHRVRAGVRRIAGVRLADPAVLGHAGRYWHDHRRRRPLNFWTIVTAAAVGAALGDWLSYWLGYHYHERIQAHVAAEATIPSCSRTGHKFFRRWGVWAIVIGRFSGPLRASVPIVAGITRCRGSSSRSPIGARPSCGRSCCCRPARSAMQWWKEYFF